jgi:nucleotide-binding universal stress UspA family protein
MSGAARQELIKLIEALWMGDYVAKITVREGRPDKVIVEEARSTNADLIIMGTPVRPGRLRLWRQNTVERVLENAPCPVLVVRPGGSPLRLPARESKPEISLVAAAQIAS